jgi:hypothetical protein
MEPLVLEGAKDTVAGLRRRLMPRVTTGLVESVQPPTFSLKSWKS